MRARASWFQRRRSSLLAGALALLLLLTQALPQGVAQGLEEGLSTGLALPRGTPTRPLPQSSEELASRSPFSQPASYPLDQRPDPALYRPHASWIGRLILPTVAETVRTPGDWVWVDVEQAPAGQEALIGRRVRLTWAELPRLRNLVDTVTTPVRLGQAAREAAAAANVVPSRLDGRLAVGPLQSLAGARPRDDMTVRLEGVSSDGDGLRIRRPPVQTTGRWMGLVTVLGAAEASGEPQLWRVRHYDAGRHGFVGPEETIRIPRLPPDRFGRVMLDPAGLPSSPLNAEGWRIFGAPAADGVFTVQALQPRALTRLNPDRVVRGTAAGLGAINRDNWSAEALQRGSLWSTALVPDGGAGLPLTRVGQRALLVHLFGGIGGAEGEPTPGWTVTGHFAFGEAEVVRDPLSGEPELTLRYHQIYANNPNGIVAGSQDWSAYAGSLQRGWVGTRPLSDLLVPLEGSLLDALALQAEILSARYRSGDGSGVALVTPATSCVQDSSQALWIALDGLRQQRRRGSFGADTRLQRLAEGLDALLTPFGMVRADWRHNAAVTLSAGTGRDQATPMGERFVSSQRLAAVLLSWRSMLPRRAHDGMATVFLRAGLPLWILRTNQIPGADPSLAPLAPTTVLGRLPVVGTLLQRLIDALFPPVLGPPLLQSVLVLAVYGALALALGFRSGFLHGPWQWRPWPVVLRHGLALLLMPAIGEELLFRVLLLPHPLEGVSPASMAAWGALSVGLFVLYHPVAAQFWYPRGRAVFRDPCFLVQCTLLGAACVLEYGLTGSLWSAAGLHWLAVLIWLEPLGGRRAL
ncbi:type II CAAX prenyl endopeptidase Rce1 family protein [Cyanobium sp. NIES-981]|uniref:CPBP family glutamic-type intramembrane protease n=1 Tax=Cyanobium sp. NIES-981 TaxID=1851505 RepID=UPI0007DD5C4E|nr:CPBP family glutamic-type intramembrane protease [Cyanobium sp. NIES-981]SBO42233.1 Abortive infection protein [Cyanobium sp. NIES-981]